jgi:hypothetical protein
MAKKTIYIVSKIGWEYNDEVYFRPESEGGTPVNAYSTKEKAQAEVDRLNAPLKERTEDDYYMRDAQDGEKANEYGCVPITENYEVVPVTMED